MDERDDLERQLISFDEEPTIPTPPVPDTPPSPPTPPSDLPDALVGLDGDTRPRIPDAPAGNDADATVDTGRVTPARVGALLALLIVLVVGIVAMGAGGKDDPATGAVASLPTTSPQVSVPATDDPRTSAPRTSSDPVGPGADPEDPLPGLDPYDLDERVLDGYDPGEADSAFSEIHDRAATAIAAARKAQAEAVKARKALTGPGGGVDADEVARLIRRANRLHEEAAKRIATLKARAGKATTGKEALEEARKRVQAAKERGKKPSRPTGPAPGDKDGSADDGKVGTTAPDGAVVD